MAIAGAALLAFGGLLLARPDPQFDVQGHRGARGMLPENTLPAFGYAADLGVTTLEMDTKVTRDGVLVVTHDSTLNPDLVRDDSGRWVNDGIPLNSLTLAEVKALDVGRLRPGSAYAQRFPDQRAIDGTRMPTLREVLDAHKDRSDIRFNIETKIEPDHPERSPTPAEFARALVEELRAAGVERRSTIQSFDWRTLQESQRIAPDIETVALTEADTTLLQDGRWTAGLRLRYEVNRHVAPYLGVTHERAFGDTARLRRAGDAVYIDTTGIGIEEVVAMMSSKVEERESHG